MDSITAEMTTDFEPAKSSEEKTEKQISPRYILITQCLQNDFFLNRESGVHLPKEVVERLLIGKVTSISLKEEKGRLVCRGGPLSDGPLGRLLKATIGERINETDGDGVLHVINILDWHQRGAPYDQERIAYGAHCLKETWGADYISGLEHLLDPSRSKTSVPNIFFSNSKLSVYHIFSNSIFDFRPHTERKECQRGELKSHPSILEALLDVLLMGTEAEVKRLKDIFSKRSCEEELSKLANEACLVELHEKDETLPEIYIAVIGVYTDIKVRMLVTGLCTRYDIRNLAVSDTFTATPTLERHFTSLDFFSKILRVEIIHGINNMVLFLGGTVSGKGDSEIIHSVPFSDFECFVNDKQNILAYESDRIQEYLSLTQKRALRVYKNIARINSTLYVFGIVFLSISLISAVWGLFGQLEADWKIPLISGGIGLIQVITIFFKNPMADMQRNLTNLATFRMILESHSLKAALARFHLTTPLMLAEKVETEQAQKQINVLKAQFEVLKELETDYQLLKDLGFGAEPDLKSNSGRKTGKHTKTA
jgi:hypothetical protein